jgi:hypothetical protein
MAAPHLKSCIKGKGNEIVHMKTQIQETIGYFQSGLVICSRSQSQVRKEAQVETKISDSH